MKTQVVITFELEGFHCWPNAKTIFPDVAFLSDMHRHVFYFKLVRSVHHDDRDVEFIRWKREVIKQLQDKYGTPLQFGSLSCESIAKELLMQHGCDIVEVWEDRENGSIVTR